MHTLKKAVGAGIFLAAATLTTTTQADEYYGSCSNFYSSCSGGYGGNPYNWSSECDEYTEGFMWSEASCGVESNYEAYAVRGWCYGWSSLCSG